MKEKNRIYDWLVIFLLALIVVLPISIFLKYDCFSVQWGTFNKVMFVLFNIFICFSLSVYFEALLRIRRLKAEYKLIKVHGNYFAWLQGMYLMMGIGFYIIYLIDGDFPIANTIIFFIFPLNFNIYNLQRVYIGEEYILILGKIIKKAEILFCHKKDNKLYLKMKDGKTIEYSYQNKASKELYDHLNEYMYSEED